MKTELQRHLTTLAPSISIQTIWECDTDIHPDIRKDCEGFGDEDPDDWQCWRSEIRATAIHNGEEITGSAYLGGTWEKYGDDPAKTNPTISGYELQMTREALTELMEEIPARSGYLKQFTAALDWLQGEAGRRYDKKQGNIATP